MSRTSRRLLLVLLLLVFAPAAPPPVSAQLFPGTGTGLPVAIEADQGIEWHQEEKAYVARGNARAKRGDTTVSADRLIAYYREATGGTEIFQLVAEGAVRIVSPSQQISGDKAVYNMDEAVGVVTGKDLKLVTATDVVTAKDSLEYYEKRGMAVARGDAIAVRQDSKMRADVLIGLFSRDAQGKTTLDRIDGNGHVVVTTANDIALCDRLMYSAASNRAILAGQVRITRGDNQINGDLAEMDMQTKVNRVLSSGRRVRGFLVPAEEAKPGAGAPAAKSPAPGR